jgi:hypothetical protein
MSDCVFTRLSATCPTDNITAREILAGLRGGGVRMRRFYLLLALMPAFACRTHPLVGAFLNEDGGLVELADGAELPDAAFDAGEPVDAGTDGGEVIDAGMDAGELDAGTDGGEPVDAGTDGGEVIDAGELDAGEPDAGMEPFDAGLPPVDTTVLVNAGPLTSSKVSVNLDRNRRRTPVVAHVPSEAGPHPIILLCPAFQTNSDAYDAYANHWASHGFLVVRSTPPNSLASADHVEMAADIRNVLDWALDPSGPLAGKGDGEHVGIIGHSLGGKVGIMVAAGDPRIDAYFGVDPVNAGNPISGFTTSQPNVVPTFIGPLTIPMAFLGETLDSSPPLGFGPACAPSSGNFLALRDAATAASPKYAWEVPNAGHMEFISDQNSCGLACLAGCHGGSVAQSDVQADTRWLSTAFFLSHLKGDHTWDAALTTQLPSTVQAR